MKIQQNRKSNNWLLPATLSLAMLVAVGVSSCGTSREQPPASDNASVASAPAAPSPEAAQAKRAATRAAPSQAASNKATAASILAQIHRADLKEIAIGKEAQAKASTSEVKAYADQLVKDHMSADQTVVAMAHNMRVHLRETSATPAVVVHEQKSSSATGAEFDRHFLQQAASDHKKLVSALQQEREDASSDELEELIDKLVPILQQDGTLAEILMKKEQA